MISATLPLTGAQLLITAEALGTRRTRSRWARTKPSIMSSLNPRGSL